MGSMKRVHRMMIYERRNCERRNYERSQYDMRDEKY